MGAAVAAGLRVDTDSGDTPLVLVTGSTRLDELDALAAEWCAGDVVHKPFAVTGLGGGRPPSAPFVIAVRTNARDCRLCPAGAGLSAEVIETFLGVLELAQETAMTTWTVAGQIVAEAGPGLWSA